MRLPEKLIDIIEEHDFNILSDNGEKIIEIERYSPANQDFIIKVDTGDRLEEFCRNIFDVYDNFDISEETALWLDDTGHGKNGAPYDMKDLYEDMEICRGYIDELYRIIANYLKSGKRNDHSK